MIVSCGPLMSPCLFVGHVHTPVSRSAAGLELLETISSPAAPMPLYSKFSTSDVFLVLSLGKSAALLWPWVMPLCCLFLVFLHFFSSFFFFFPPQCTEHPKATSEIFAPACAWHTGAVCMEAAAVHPLTQVLAVLRKLIAWIIFLKDRVGFFSTSELNQI